MIKLLDDLMPNFDVMRSCLNREKEKDKCGTNEYTSVSTAAKLSSAYGKTGSLSPLSVISPAQDAYPKVPEPVSVFKPGDQVKWFSELEGNFINSIFEFVEYASGTNNELVIVKEVIYGRTVVHHCPVRILSHAELEPRSMDGWSETTVLPPSKIKRIWHRMPIHMTAYLFEAAYFFEDQHWEAARSRVRYSSWISLKRAIEDRIEK